MDTERMLALQLKAKEGREAEDLLAEKFGDAWLGQVERHTLVMLLQAQTMEDFLAVRAAYEAAKLFREHLLAAKTAGRRAAGRLKEELAHESI